MPMILKTGNPNTDINNSSVTEVRCEIFDIPYDELRQFAFEMKATLHTNMEKKRAFVIHNPINVNKEMDTSIWLYSIPVKIKPAEIISE
jgi:hypothetical protein